MANAEAGKRQKPAEPSGVVTLEGDKVIWHNEDVVFATFSLSDVVAIGEYTNSNGPWFDDWFLVFVMKDESWSKISNYAENIDVLRAYLAQQLDPDLKAGYLFFSTSWNSMVNYPVSVKGRPLFELVPSDSYHPPRNIFQKLLHSLGIGKFDPSMKIELAAEVRKLMVKRDENRSIN
jgi:hypothetical protein